MPKPKKPSVAELQNQVDDLTKRLQDEEAARFQMRKMKDVEEKKAEEFKAEAVTARAKQSRAEDAAREAERARLDASKRAAADKVLYEQKISDAAAASSLAEEKIAAARAGARAAADSYEQKIAVASREKPSAAADAELRSQLEAQSAELSVKSAELSKLKAELRKSGIHELAQQLGAQQEGQLAAKLKTAEDAAWEKGYAQGHLAGAASSSASQPLQSDEQVLETSRTVLEEQAVALKEAELVVREKERVATELERQLESARAALSLAEQRCAAREQEIRDLRRSWDVAEAHTRELLQEVARHRANAIRPGEAALEVVVGSESSPSRPLTVPARMEATDQQHAALLMQKVRACGAAILRQRAVCGTHRRTLRHFMIPPAGVSDPC